MILVYRYIFQIGQNEHVIELYEDWTERDGCIGLRKSHRSTRFSEVNKAMNHEEELTLDQRKVVRQCGKDHVQFIAIDPDGKTLESF